MKLSAKAVRTISEMGAETKSKDIAKIYGVSIAHVRRIRAGSARKYVPRGEPVLVTSSFVKEIYGEATAAPRKGEDLDARDRSIALEHEVPLWFVQMLASSGKIAVKAPRKNRAEEVEVVFGDGRPDRLGKKRLRRARLSNLERYCTESLALEAAGLPHSPELDVLWRSLTKKEQEECKTKGAAGVLGAEASNIRER